MEPPGDEPLVDEENLYPVSERDPCPCCGHLTLNSRGRRHVCHVCYWEDDDHDNDSLDEESGWNNMTLRQGRVNFLRLGVCEPGAERNTRRPKPGEVKRRTFDERGEEVATHTVPCTPDREL